MTLKSNTLTGLFWRAISQYGVQIINVIVTMILARQINPAAFGLIAMITVFSNFSEILIDFGFKSSIVQHKDVSSTDLSSIFWLTLGVGCLLTILLSLFSGVVANIYDEPKLIPLTIFISFSFIFTALSVVQTALFNKELDFKSLATRNLIAVLISGIVAIILGFLDYGEWAIAIQLVLNSFLSAALIWQMSDWVPGLTFQLSSIKKYFGLSSALFINSSLNYFLLILIIL